MSKNLQFLLNHPNRYAVLRGGTRSGKTWAVLQYIALHALAGSFRLCSIVSHSVPHLRRGAQRDWEEIIAPLQSFVRYNATQRTYKFPTGAVVEFFSADDSAKLRGAQRDWLFINEVNLLDEKSFSELDVRTKQKVIVDFNPVSRFWIEDLFAGMGVSLEDNTVVTTYLDNPYLSEEQKAAIESRSGIEQWWRVYGLGQWGESTGQAWYNWEEAALELPDAADVVGVDFGEGAAPTAVVAVWKYKDGYAALELAYGNLGLWELVAVLSRVRAGLIVGDPAQMDYINQLRRHGVDIYPAKKKQLSASFALLNAQKLYLCGRNLIREAKELQWADAGRGLLKVGQADHAVDAVRYALHAIL